MHGHKCEDCEAKDTPENPVTYDVDPFNYEINDDSTKYWLCANCRQSSADDI
jgi:hypothetical protein